MAPKRPALHFPQSETRFDLAVTNFYLPSMPGTLNNAAERQRQRASAVPCS
jgi:hypothetical protein